METNTQWRELLERAKNFRINFDSSEENIVANQKFYMTLCNAKNNILEKLDQTVVMNNDQILELSFSEIYSLLISQIPEAKFFGKEYAFFEDVYAACLFISLSTFLHSTKRLNGMSLREFTYTHSHYGYNDKKSIHYFPFGDMHNEKLLPDESTLRKSRNRHLSTHSVYYKDSEWSAMPKDSEHEWAFYFYLNKSAEPGEQLIHERVCDTFKRTKIYTQILTEPSPLQWTKNIKLAWKPPTKSFPRS